MRTEASNEAYRNPGNKTRRKSKKELIHQFFISEALFTPKIAAQGKTYPEVAALLKIDMSNAQKRCSDLCKEGKLKIMGRKGRHSLYIIDDWSTPKLTKPEAYNMAVKTFCNLETQQAIHKYVKDNT